MNDQQPPNPDLPEPDVEHTVPLPAAQAERPSPPDDTARFAPPEEQQAGRASESPTSSGDWPAPPHAPGQQMPGQHAPGQQSAYGPVGPNPGGPHPGATSVGPGPVGYPAPQPQQWNQRPAQPARAKVSRGIWPAVALLSLLIGLVGGALGGAAMTSWQDDSDEPGRTSNGLSDVDTVTTPPLPADNGSIVAVADKLLPSTVQILADFNGEEGGATGSGFFLDKQGHVVTNNHVVAEAADGGKITVVDHEGNRYPATVVGRSPVYDLAVLYVKDVKNIKPAALGASKSLRVGENVVAIGSPLGLSSTVTAGIVSALDRPVTTGGQEDSQSYINAVQTDAAINPGNSGGPLVNLAGQVVGVNSAIATTGGSSTGQESGNIGVGFAIPIEQVKVTADQILRDGEARYPVIGATVNSDGTGDGAHIQEVVKGSPAEEAGLKKGDVVNALDDRVITDSPTLIVAIRSHLPGDTVKLTVDRGGDEKTVKITLDSKVG
ncbi:S1C family serine protease [Nocardioides jensenii]|uniref:S1C family serine protease n=1 Tax=Nocardioides jensenii TaxID=1843 RepID=UPI00082EE116|nr:trypsin-like peptidase domain-containing protein [Nocardioides jensenii]